MTASPARIAAWRQQRERSSTLVIRFMVWVSLTFGRPAGRALLRIIAAYFLLFNPTARRASRDYLRRILQRSPRLGDCYRHFFTFATTIHDRIFLLNDRLDLFDVRVFGADLLRQHAQQKQGVLLFGAHLGSFEMMRAMGSRETGLRVTMVMYEDNARKLARAFAAINPAVRQDVVPLGRAESMLQVRDKLDAGHMAGILCDRDLGDNDHTVTRDFLGAPAQFPLGPFRMAAMLRRPVLFMTGLYVGDNRYELHFEPLADFTRVERGERDAAIDAAQRRYVELLARYCRYAPDNWFNFFDFWAPAHRA